MKLIDFSIVDLLSNLKNLTVIPCNTDIETVDVSKSLLTPGRLLFPKVAKKSKLDELLTRRAHLKVLEERALSLKKVRVRNFAAHCIYKFRAYLDLINFYYFCLIWVPCFLWNCRV